MAALDGLQELYTTPRPWNGRAGEGEQVGLHFDEIRVVTGEPGKPFIGGRFTISIDSRGNEVARHVDELYRTRLLKGEYPPVDALRLLDDEALPEMMSASAGAPQ